MIVNFMIQKVEINRILRFNDGPISFAANFSQIALTDEKL